MADVILECPQCRRQTVVSEHVSEKNVPCSGCGALLPLQKQSAPSRFKLRKPPAAPPSAEPAVAAPLAAVEHTRTEDRRDSAYLKRDVQRVRRRVWMQRLSWVGFLLLAGGLYYLRFKAHLPAATAAQVQQGGLIALAVMYVLVIMMALQDNMFDGLLALAVPFYPLYYLFNISGAVFVRALTGALLVGFGYDALNLLQEMLTNLFDVINVWIRSN
ncbi:MAG: hypothetical protein ABR497_08505 [Kiritimatiellia bacterium]|nr:hypothetical protein [Lentisphaerota bacterium]